MRRLLCSVATCLALLAGAGDAMAQTPPPDITPGGKVPTTAETIEIGASTREIAITSDFRGADFTLFGALHNVDDLFLAIGQYDIVVILEGPRDSATVRKKDRVFGIWMNGSAVTFDDLPTSYSMASTRDLEVISKNMVFDEFGIGIGHIALSPVSYTGNIRELNEFREAYRRLKLRDGQYWSDVGGVRLERSGLFWATLRLPANIPDGVHIARAYLLKGGQYVAQRSLPLRVVKTGMEQAITDAAHETPLAYGVLCVLIAVITGWSASILFRRD